MATCSLILDKRVKLKNDNFNLSIRVISRKQQVYLNLSKMTEKQYSTIFDKKNMGEKSVDFRNQCLEKVAQVEKILSEMKIFDRKTLKDRFFNKLHKVTNNKNILELSSLFILYCEENSHLSYATKSHIKDSKNVFTRDNSSITVFDITPEFLRNNEIKRSKEGASISSINSNFRDLRTVINYFSKKNRLIPDTYYYPFGKGGYSICEYYPKKQVFSNKEIEMIVNLKDFQSKDEEFARDIWELLYRCNGINFADLLRLRWDHRQGKCFVFFRKKTENTRKKFRKEIVVPINDRVQYLLDKVGDYDSKFVLGYLKESYTESNFSYINRKKRKIINNSLESLSNRLGLSVKLETKTARDSYASVLKRSGVSVDKISEMLSHSNSNVTRHYLDSLDMETVFDINENLI